MKNGRRTFVEFLCDLTQEVSLRSHLEQMLGLACLGSLFASSFWCVRSFDAFIRFTQTHERLEVESLWGAVGYVVWSFVFFAAFSVIMLVVTAWSHEFVAKEQESRNWRHEGTPAIIRELFRIFRIAFAYSVGFSTLAKQFSLMQAAALLLAALALHFWLARKGEKAAVKENVPRLAHLPTVPPVPRNRYDVIVEVIVPQAIEGRVMMWCISEPGKVEVLCRFLPHQAASIKPGYKLYVEGLACMSTKGLTMQEILVTNVTILARDSQMRGQV